MNKALGEFLEREGPRLLRCACGITRNHEDARELVAEASRRLLAHWENVDGPAMPYMVRIMRNYWIGQRTSLEARVTGSLDEPLGNGAWTFADVIPAKEDLAGSVDKADNVARVRRILRQLSPEHCAALMLVDMECLPFNQAAHELGVNRGTLGSRVSRARAAFRQAWGGIAAF